MAINLTENQIQFNNIAAPGKKMGQVLSKSGYKDLYGNIIDDEYEGNIQDPAKFINAVDIDWNGALVDNNTTINSTGDLLKVVKDIKEVVDLGALNGKNGSYHQWAYKNAATGGNAPESSAFYPPTGWTTLPSTPNFANGEYTWCIERTVTFDSNNLVQYGNWCTPYRITGADGKDGEDGADIEFIYTRNNTGVAPAAPSSNNDYLDDWAGTDSNGVEWTDNPQGVSDNLKWEYICQRTKSNGTWSDYGPNPAAVWSKWGEKGQDGDGYEYIYKNFSTEQTFTNTNDNPAYWSAVQADEYYGPQGHTWSDDPVGVNSTNKFEYVSTRKKIAGIWSKFTTPKLWANYSESGEPGESAVYLEITPDSGIVYTNEYNRTQELILLKFTIKMFVGENLTTFMNFNHSFNFNSYSGWTFSGDDSVAGSFTAIITIPTSYFINDPIIKFPFTYLGFYNGKTYTLNSEYSIYRVNNGAQGLGSFVSVVFKLSAQQPSTPTGGDFSDPIPSSDGWSDGFPALTSGQGPIWYSKRRFYSDGTTGGNWTTPVLVLDTENMDMEFSPYENANANTPVDANRHGGSGTQIWFDPVEDANSLPVGKTWEDMIWMAIREKTLSNLGVPEWSAWRIIKIKGESYQGLTQAEKNEIINSIQGDLINGEQGFCVVATPSTIIWEKELINTQAGTQIGFNTKLITLKVYKDDTEITNFNISNSDIKSANNFLNNTITKGVLKTAGVSSVTINYSNNNDDNTLREETLFIPVEFTYDNVSHTIYTSVQIFINLERSIKTTVKEDVETTIASKIATGINDNEITTLENIGTYIRSASNASSELTETVNGFTTDVSRINQAVNEISSIVGERDILDSENNSVYNLFKAPGTVGYSGVNINLHWEPGIWTGSSGLSNGNGVNCIRTKTNNVSGENIPPGLITYFEEVEPNIYSEQIFEYTNEDLTKLALVYDIPSNYKVKASVVIFKINGSTYKVPNGGIFREEDFNNGFVDITLNETGIYCFRVSFLVTNKSVGNDSNIVNQIISELNPKFGVVKVKKSLIEQTAKNIKLQVENCGINLDNKEITFTSDKFTVNNLDGQQVLGLNNEGDFEVSGTIKSKNFYHNVCIFTEGNELSSSLLNYKKYYCSYGTSITLSNGETKSFLTGNYYDEDEYINSMSSSSKIEYFRETSYDADVIIMIPDIGKRWGSELIPNVPDTKKTVYLPDPDDFEGKVIDVQTIEYLNSNGNPRVGCVVSDAFGVTLYNNDGNIVCGQTSTMEYDTLTPGSTTRYISIRCYKNNVERCIWYKLTEHYNYSDLINVLDNRYLLKS